MMRKWASGKDLPQTRIRDDQILEIYTRYVGGESLRDLAQSYGVGKSTIHRVVQGQRANDPQRVKGNG